jgi:hypothetical protein
MQIRRSILFGVWLVGATQLQMLQGQTQVDLRTQSKSVDFSGANTTKPFKSGTTLPATCGVGEVFFQTNAPAGLNVYGCTAVNSWTLLSAGVLAGDVTGTPSASTVTRLQGRSVASTAPTNGQSLAWNSTSSNWTPQTVTGTQGPQGPAGPTGSQGPQGATGTQGPAGSNGAISRVQNSGTNLPVEATLNFTGGGCTDNPGSSRTDCTGSGGISGLSIALNGTTQGTQPTLNFIAGTGIVQACVNNTGASRVDCTPSYNSAVIPTHDTIHSNEIYCASSNGTTLYTCALPNKALLSYSPGQMFLLNVDATCATSCSLNIDSVGVRSIKKKDGVTDPGGVLIAGQAQLAWFDGTIIRLMYY